MLRRCMIYELKRAFESAGTKISILIGSVIVLTDLVMFYLEYGSANNRRLIQAWIGTDYQFAYNGLFYILLPVLACLPYAGSYFQDIHTGYDKNICIRISRKQYLFSKCLAVYVSAFVCTTVPLLLNLFLAAGIYPNALPLRLDFLCVSASDIQRFPVLCSLYPVVYCLVFILIDGLFAGALALVSIAVTKYCRSQFTTIITPFVIYIITSLLMTGGENRSIAVMEMLNPIQNYTSTYQEMCIMYLFILTSSVIAIWFLGRKRDIL